MNTKRFFWSKLNWSGIVLVLIALKDFIPTLDFSKMTVNDWITAVIGILVIVFRTYFTSTQISGATTPPVKSGTTTTNQ